MQQTEFFFILDHFLSFAPVTTQKSKILVLHFTKTKILHLRIRHKITDRTDRLIILQFESSSESNVRSYYGLLKSIT